MTPKKQQLLRQLPSVAGLLELDEVNEWLAGLPRATVVASLRAAVEELRARIVSGKLSGAVDRQELLALAEQRLHDSSIPSLRRVVNATGIVLHTALGRAPLADAVIEAIADACAGYCNLEYDIDAGGRGQRNAHVVDELTRLTGAEAATVVNNNAAATMLILQTLAAGREVVVSRGQLIEIGGSFRLPDIVRAGGVTLREVGTTNRTRLSDYERAITDATAALMHVHTSNYRIIGFTESVPVGALATLAHRFGLIAVDDQGSGALVEVEHLGLPPEPCVRHSIECGVDLVCFSGDKLLGGPQCGIIVGRCELIERLNSNPLMRTYRVDKLTLLALEATLRCYRDPDSGTKEVPALAMLTASTDELADRAGALCDRLTA
ncbi:MAG: L-seryl-tRNA(Sec) selenium transferase, partial [Phycisphaerae bacterium]